MEEKTKLKLRRIYWGSLVVVFSLWLILNLPVRVTVMVFGSYLLLLLFHWSGDVFRKVIPAMLLTFTIGLAGTIIQTLSFGFMEYPVIFASIVTYANVGLGSYIFLQRQLKKELPRLY